jgi:hypothetical protein
MLDGFLTAMQLPSRGLTMYLGQLSRLHFSNLMQLNSMQLVVPAHELSA